MMRTPTSIRGLFSTPSLDAKSVLLAAMLALAPSIAAAQSPTPADEPDPAPSRPPKIVIRGCPAGPRLDVGSLAYVACGATVFVMERRADGAIFERGRQRVAGTVLSFFERNGVVWAELRGDAGEQSAAPITLDPVPPPPPSYDARQPPPAPLPPPGYAAPAPRYPPKPEDPDRWSRRATARRVPGAAIRAGVAPFLGDGEGGAVFTGGLTYRAQVPFALHAALDPAAIGSNIDGSISTYAVRLDATLDTDYLEIGFGTGSQRYRDEIWERDRTLVYDRHAPNLGFRARFGAIDGIHGDVRVRWAFLDGVPRFSDVFMEFLVPTWKHGWLVVSTGLGPPLGIMTTSVGVRSSAFGSTTSDRVFLTVAIGWTEIRDDRNDWERDRTAMGFQVAFALEYRIPSKKTPSPAPAAETR
jgi:hypothetical protein